MTCSKLEEDGIEPSRQLREVFSQKSQRRSEPRGEEMGLEKGGKHKESFSEDENFRELPSDETPRTDLESDTLYSSSIGSGEELVE